MPAALGVRWARIGTVRAAILRRRVTACDVMDGFEVGGATLIPHLKVHPDADALARERDPAAAASGHGEGCG